MALTSVVMDKAERLAFVGGMNGKIAQVNLFLQVNVNICMLFSGLYLSYLTYYGTYLFLDVIQWVCPSEITITALYACRIGLFVNCSFHLILFYFIRTHN